LRSPRVLEGYLPEDKVEGLAYRFALQPADEREADLIIRGVPGLRQMQGDHAELRRRLKELEQRLDTELTEI
jgi:hypothetical protein